MNQPLEDLVQAAQQAKADEIANSQIIRLIDLTTLNENDTQDSIKILCDKALTAQVAAVCVYPQYITLAKDSLDASSIKVATVVNFPHGNSDINLAIQETEMALHAGADEIDLVAPYNCYFENDRKTAVEMIEACKSICGARTLKVIIETGALKTPDLIRMATEDAIEAGANFVKTSTGKIEAGATLEAAAIILNSIKESNRNVGIKISGGLRTKEQCAQYLKLAELIMGTDWISPKTFRIGASSLLDNL